MCTANTILRYQIQKETSSFYIAKLIATHMYILITQAITKPQITWLNSTIHHIVYPNGYPNNWDDHCLALTNDFTEEHSGEGNFLPSSFGGNSFTAEN